MPKVKRPRAAGGVEAAAAVAASLAEQILESEAVKSVARVKRRGKAARYGGGAAEEEEYVDDKLTRRILEQARIQQEELETEHGAGKGTEAKKQATVLGESDFKIG